MSSYASWSGYSLGQVQNLEYISSTQTVSLVPYGNSIVLDVPTQGGNAEFLNVDISNTLVFNTSNLPATAFGPGIPNFGNTNGSSPQTALFVNQNTGVVQHPTSALIRLINLQIPDGGGSATLKDSNNNYYSSDDWIACCVGFSNSSGDRAYACYSTGIAGNNWQITYTFAGTGSGSVQVLAIHKSLLGCYSPG